MPIIGPGDVFEFGAGFECWFTVHETLKKTLGYLDPKGEIEYDTTTITCDKCETALEADVPWYREANPKGGAPVEWCERCFQTHSDPRDFTKQVRGKATGYLVKPGSVKRRRVTLRKT